MDLLRISAYGLAHHSNGSLYWFTSDASGIENLRFAGRILTELGNSPVSLTKVLGAFAAKQRPQARADLQRLLELGLIEPFWKEQRNSSKKGVRLIGLSGDESQALLPALDRYGLANCIHGFPILVASDWLDPRIGQFSRTTRSEWLLVSLAGKETRIGPRFSYGKAPCYQCLELRLREKDWLREQLPAGIPTIPADLRNIQAAAALVASRLSAFLQGTWCLPHGVLWAFDWTTLHERREQASRFPHCSACGHPPSSPAPFSLSNLRGCYSNLRSMPPAGVVKRLRSVVGPVTGIVRTLDSTPLHGTFCSTAYVTPAIAPRGLRVEGGIVRPEICSGRGWTRAASLAGCLAESVERYAIQFRGDEARFAARYHELAGFGVHPDSVQLFSMAQFRNREKLNLRYGSTSWVPEPFDSGEKIEWREGWSLTAQEKRFVPMALCSTSYRPPGARPIGNCDTNGCAAAAAPEEAILHALLEVIERDAVAIWWYNRLEPTELPPNRLLIAGAARAAEQLEALGWKVRLADLTTDIAIPVVAATGISSNGDTIFGFGAHPSLKQAASAAVAELAQMSHRRISRVALPPFRMPLAKIRLRPYPERVNLKSVLQACQANLEKAGYECIAVDMSRPEIAFAVQRVVVPGLRPWHPRFAPGRLFDVPVKMGWLKSPLPVGFMRRYGF